MKNDPIVKLNNVSLGKNTKISKFVNLYYCKVGDHSKVGAFVEIQKGVTIGKNCKISSHSFICEGVTIKNNVFIGHNVTFINDRFPRAVNNDNKLKGDNDWTLEKTIVENNVSIGSSVTIMCGVTIGEGSMIGAGTVVTKNVPPNTLVIGVPGKIVKKLE